MSDHGRVQVSKPRLTKLVVEPVLSLDQKMQPPLTILDVERQEITGPGRKMIGPLGRELERLAVSALVHDALAQSPSVNDVGNDARERRLRRTSAQLDNQLRAKRAHRCKLQPHIGLI